MMIDDQQIEHNNHDRTYQNFDVTDKLISPM